MKTFLFTVALLLSVQSSFAEDGYKTSYKDGGGGVWWSSADENLKVGLMGYAQTVQKWYISDTYSNNADYPLAFSIRRARIDFSATVMKNHTLLIEYDGAPATSVSAASPAGFGLVEAHTTHKLHGDMVQLRLGKFVVPFSTEGSRSSRAYDTVERYMLLNSMYGLPGLDTQYGAMLFGKLLDNNALSWFLAVSNGNAKASANATENNSAKEYNVKVAYDVWKDDKAGQQLSVGVGYDHSNELDQTVSLKDLMGATYQTMSITGKRDGVSADAFFMMGDLSVRTEVTYYKMQQPGDLGDASLFGGFLQAAYFVTGSEKDGGFQPLVRAEYTKMTGGLPADADHLTAFTGGYQWFIHSNIRHQLNLVATMPGAATSGTYATDGTKFGVLSEVQIKF